jgi:hypothetical protein
MKDYKWNFEAHFSDPHCSFHLLIQVNLHPQSLLEPQLYLLVFLVRVRTLIKRTSQIGN